MTHRPEPHILLFRRPKDFDTAVAQQKHQAAMADMAVHKRQALVNDNDGQFVCPPRPSFFPPSPSHWDFFGRCETHACTTVCAPSNFFKEFCVRASKWI